MAEIAADSRVVSEPVRHELKRALTLGDLVVYGLIFIVPIAPFSIFGIVYNASHGMVALVYLIGLVAMSLTAISYMTMSAACPLAGSGYSYARFGMGEWAGFIAGWAMLLDYLLIPGLAYLGPGYALKDNWQASPVLLWVFIFLAINTALNVSGVESLAKANRFLLLVQLLILAAFLTLAGVGVLHGTAGARISAAPFFDSNTFSASIIFGAVSMGVLSFLGFDGISTLAEEAQGSRKIVGRATLLALAFAACLFILQSYLASLFVLGRPAFPPGEPTYNAFYGIAAMVGGGPMRFAASVLGVVLSGAACALVAQAATARLLYAMGRDGQLPSFLAHVSRRRVPTKAILLVAAMTLAIAVGFLERLELLVSIVTFGALTGFLLLHLSVIAHFVVRQRSRQWVLHLAVPAIGILILVYVMINMNVMAQLLGVAWLAVGILLYLLRARKRRNASAAYEVV